MSAGKVSKAWSPFRGWISVILILLGFSGFVEIIREWIRVAEHPLGNWYIENSWIFLVVVFMAWVFLWGTYKSYIYERAEREKERKRADDLQRLLDNIQSENAERERRIKEKQERKIDLEVDQLESQKENVQVLWP